MQKIVVFGSINMDLTIEADRIPLQGETMAGRNFFTNSGGKGANQAAAAAKFGVPTLLVGAAGADGFGDQLVSQLKGYGVSCEEVVREDGVSTGVAVIVRVDGDNRIILDTGANHALQAEQVVAALDRIAQPGDVFLTQFECDHQATFAAIKSAHERGMYVVVNIAPPCELPEDVWAAIDLVCVNETECEAATGVMPNSSETIEQALLALKAKGARVPVITLGSQGSAAYWNGRVITEPSINPQVVDTTGAGDTYIGVLCAAYVEAMAFDAAMAWASAAAGIATTRAGAQQAIPLRAEVEAFMAQRGRA